MANTRETPSTHKPVGGTGGRRGASLSSKGTHLPLGTSRVHLCGHGQTHKSIKKANDGCVAYDDKLNALGEEDKGSPEVKINQVDRHCRGIMGGQDLKRAMMCLPD